MADHSTLPQIEAATSSDAAVSWWGIDLTRDDAALVETLSAVPATPSLDTLLTEVDGSGGCKAVIVYASAQRVIEADVRDPSETDAALGAWIDRTSAWIGQWRRHRGRVHLVEFGALRVQPERFSEIFASGGSGEFGAGSPLPSSVVPPGDPVAMLLSRLAVAQSPDAARLMGELQASSLWSEPEDASKELRAAQARFAELERRAEKGWMLQDARNRYLEEELGHAQLALTDAQKRIDIAQRHASDVQAAKAAVDQLLDRTKSDLVACQQVIHSAQTRVHDLETSTSWRLMRPARGVADFFKGLRHRRR